MIQVGFTGFCPAAIVLQEARAAAGRGVPVGEGRPAVRQRSDAYDAHPCMRAAPVLAAARRSCAARRAAEFVVRSLRRSRRPRPSSARSRAATRRARARPYRRHRSAKSRSSEGSDVQEGQVIAVVVDEKLALQRDAADAQMKALSSQLDNAHDGARAGAAAACQSGSGAAVPRRSGPHAGRGPYQPARRGAGRAAPSSSSRPREGEVLAPASGRVLTVPVTPGLRHPGRRGDRADRRRRLLPAPVPAGAARRRDRRGRHRAGGRAVVSAGSDRRRRATRDGRLVKVYPEIGAAAFRPTSRSKALATISSASVPLSGSRSAGGR